MKSSEIRQDFLNFFREKGHTILPSASLIPENDPTVLFTTAGMHPLVPFLLGEKHPAGKRLANCQPCVRTDDIYEVGDEVHHTFFEMLGNWSLGDYFKEEAIKLSFEFLTSKKWLGLEKEKLAISVFKGDKDAPKDEESIKVWLSLGVIAARIKELPKKDNWWGPAGQVGPCGPDTEMFYWVGKEPAPKEFDPKDKRWVEIWNDVFMQYFKNMDGKYQPLSQKNVDTGMGLERMLSAINGLGDDYKTDVFWPIIQKIEELSGKKYDDYKKEFRIIADHIKAAVFLISEGILPGKNERESVLRRLIRSANEYKTVLNLPKNFLIPLSQIVIEIYKDFYPKVKLKENDISIVIQKEEENFEKTEPEREKTVIIELNRRKRKDSETHTDYITGATKYDIFGTTGVAGPRIDELAKQYNIEIRNPEGYTEGEGFRRHQELSRTASAGMFKGGLADTGEKAVKYHTATHLLLAALRQVLGSHVYQRGSNINAERLRFDFSHPQKMTEEDIKKVEEIVNKKIKEDLPVVCEETTLEKAKERGAMGVFENKYGERVKVYSISEFSKEICGGPHVKKTSELGNFRIIKEESCGAGIRRIRAILE